MLTKAPKGMKDILPDQIYKWDYVEKVFKDLCGRYGFKEIRTPVLEHTELFTRGVGDTTDIVEKQMYSFDDYAGRGLTLRPEGTASVVRAFVENKLYAETKPAKFFYEIACFRYEKPQSGRLREFHQFGVEIFGSDNMLADAEVITLAADFLAALGVGNTALHINSIGCPDCRAPYREKLRDFLRPRYDELCDTCKERFHRNPLRVLDCKSAVCRELTAGAPRMLDHLCDACRADFKALGENLTASGVDFEIDAGIVRGLDYYTKTAFEFISENIGAQGTVCGGGRYDGLIEQLGGPPSPGVGFGLGIERLLLVMEAAGLAPLQPAACDAFIACAGEAGRAASLSLARRLRAAGLRVETDALGRNLKGQFKYADKLGARHVLVLGEDELQRGEITIRDMGSGEQRRIAMRDAEAEILVTTQTPRQLRPSRNLEGDFPSSRSF
jgi:histidyl-tRNA synthetase